MLDKTFQEFLVFGNEEKGSAHRVLKEVSLKVSKGFSFESISQNTNVKKERVEEFLEIFEFLKIIKRVENFLEGSKEFKYYFYDLEIRNFLVKNFEGFDKRNDFYELFENYMIVERFKKLKREKKKTKMFFWKTQENKEIPLVEKCGDCIQAFEFEKEKRIPNGWIAEFAKENPEAGFRYIDTNSVEDMEWFLGKEKKVEKDITF